MLTIENLRVRSLDLEANTLFWRIANTIEDVLDFTVEVLRSEALAGPYEVRSPPLKDQYTFRDFVPLGVHRYRQLHYKLRVTQLSTGRVVETDPVQDEPTPDLISMAIRKDFLIVMKENGARECLVLPVRTFGQRCSCWDKTLQKQRVTGCRLCYDTGFLYGYLAPMRAWVSMDPNPDNTQVSTTGPTQQQDSTARMGYTPPVKPDDIIVESENRRWFITKVTGPEHNRVRTRQELELHQVQPGDIEYGIDVQFTKDLANLETSPERNLTMPTNLEGRGMPDYLAAYFPGHRS